MKTWKIHFKINKIDKVTSIDARIISNAISIFGHTYDINTITKVELE